MEQSFTEFGRTIETPIETPTETANSGWLMYVGEPRIPQQVQNHAATGNTSELAEAHNLLQGKELAKVFTRQVVIMLLKKISGSI